MNRPIRIQELLEDLRRNFSVVREQSSWGEDTNPFCCDRCWQSSPSLPEVPGGENTTTIAPPTDVPPYQNNANTREIADEPALEGDEHEETLALGASELRLGNNGNVGGGDASPNNSGAAGGNQASSRLLPTAVSGSFEEAEVREGAAVVSLMPATPADPATLVLEREEAARLPLPVEANGVEMRGSKRAGEGPPQPSRRPEAIAAAFAAHLHGVDKNPLELARLCRFAQFLTENELLREAYEVS